MRVLTIKSNVINYHEEVKAPTIIINAGLFSQHLNAVLVSRYIDLYTVKEGTVQKRIESNKKTMDEYKETPESVEYTTAAAKLVTAQADAEAYAALLVALKNVRKDFPDYEDCPEDMRDVVELYSCLYCTAGAIDTIKNTNKAIVLNGITKLYDLCAEYADRYETTADTWTEARHEDFKAVKAALVEFGSRLNGDVTVNRKGFKYSASTKDVARLLAFCTKKNGFNQKSGDHKETRNTKTAFQHTAICTVLRMDESQLSDSAEEVR
ncbi:MAG: hypothetical protein ACLTWK_00105 [Eisenbergiella sp.]